MDYITAEAALSDAEATDLDAEMPSELEWPSEFLDEMQQDASEVAFGQPLQALERVEA